MKHLLTTVATCILLSACVTPGQMLPGNIVAEEGDVLDFQIEVAKRSGKVAASNPRTGEQFSGKYVGILERVTSFSSGYAQASGLGSSVTASGFGSASAGSNIANATAFLKGNKGTTLNCEMQIEAGLNPHGIGQCTDQGGARYRLQF
jgi:hypothetical protein